MTSLGPLQSQRFIVLKIQSKEVRWTKVYYIFQNITEEEISTILSNKEANIQEQNQSKLQN